MDLKKLNANIRNTFRKTGHHKGWKVQYIGNTLTLTCTEFDVQFVDVMTAIDIIKRDWHIDPQTKPHFSTNDTYAVVVNWVA